MKQNITLSIEKDLIRKAKILAARKDTSISKLLSEEWPGSSPARIFMNLPGNGPRQG